MNKTEEVMKTAIQMEKDGIKYYTDAAGKIKNEAACKMFKFLIEDEKRHIERWKSVSVKEGFTASEKKESLKTAGKIKTIFSSVSPGITENIQASSEEADVLTEAIKLEEKGIQYYSEKSKELEGKAAELCKIIAEEEKTHRDILLNTLEYIQHNWQWNVDTENWAFEG